MTYIIRDAVECTTHHNACDCRERARHVELTDLRAKVERLEGENELYRVSLKAENDRLERNDTLAAENERLHNLVCQIWLEISTTDLDPETADSVREEVAKEYAALTQEGKE